MNHITRPPRFPSMGRPNLLPTYEDLHLSMERESKFNFWCSQLHRSSQPHCSSVRKATIDEIVYIVLTKKLPSSQRILPQAGGDLTLAAQYLSYDLALMFDTCKPSHTAQWFDKIHLSLIRLAASQAGPDYRLQTSASRLNQLLNLNTTVAAILAQNGNGAPAVSSISKPHLYSSWHTADQTQSQSLSFPSVNMPMESQQAPKRPAASSPENPTVKRQRTTDRAEIPGECPIQGCALAWNVKGRASLMWVIRIPSAKHHTSMYGEPL